MLPSRLGGLSIGDTGLGRIGGQGRGEHWDSRGEEDDKTQPHVAVPPTKLPALAVVLGDMLYNARASLTCGAQQVRAELDNDSLAVVHAS
jgi:hypothetical protein